MESSNKASGLCEGGMSTIEEACEFSRLSRTELYAMMNGGRLAFVKHGRRRLVPRKSLVQMLEAGLHGGNASD